MVKLSCGFHLWVLLTFGIFKEIQYFCDKCFDLNYDFGTYLLYWSSVRFSVFDPAPVYFLIYLEASVPGSELESELEDLTDLVSLA